MFCEMCGKRLEDTSKFCPYCGHKISVDPSSEPTNYIDEIEKAPVAEYSPKTDITPVISTASQPTDKSVSLSPPAEERYSQPEKKKGGNKAIIAVLVIVLLLGAAFGAFWFITDGELFNSELFNKETTQPTDSQNIEDTALPSVNSATSQSVLAPDTAMADEIRYVNVASAAVYAGPDTSVYKAICNASKGDALVVKGTHSNYPDWIYVYSSKVNAYGWISAALLSESEYAEVPTTDFNTNTEVLYYDASARFDVMISVGEGHNLNLRRQPDTTDPDNVIVLIPDRARATVLGLSSKDTLWYYVEYTDEFATYYGYIHSDHTLRYY